MGSPYVMVCTATFGLVNRIEKGKKREEGLIIKEMRVHFSAPGVWSCGAGDPAHALPARCQGLESEGGKEVQAPPSQPLPGSKERCRELGWMDGRAGTHVFRPRCLVLGINSGSVNHCSFSLRSVRSNSVFMRKFPLRSIFSLGCNYDEGSFHLSPHRSPERSLHSWAWGDCASRLWEASLTLHGISSPVVYLEVM